MARTYRDHPSFKHFWRWHETHCTCGCHTTIRRRLCYWNCSCMKADPHFPRGESWIGPVPPWWNKQIRQKERAFTRNRMQRARAGSRGWSSVDEKRGDDYYW